MNRIGIVIGKAFDADMLVEYKVHDGWLGCIGRSRGSSPLDRVEPPDAASQTEQGRNQHNRAEQRHQSRSGCGLPERNRCDADSRQKRELK